MSSTALLPSTAYQPPEQVLDEYHPHNSAFFKTQQQLKQNILYLSQQMKSNHVQVAKMRLRGLKNTEIAEEIGLLPASISNIVAREDVQKLLAALGHLQAHNDGPSLEHRKHLLWRIASDRYDDEPKTAISAISEMNKMDGIGQANGQFTLETDKEGGVKISMNFGPPSKTSPAPPKDVTPPIEHDAGD